MANTQTHPIVTNGNIEITINHSERIFAVYGHNRINPVLCNLEDMKAVYNMLIPVTKIQHLFDGRFQRFSRKDLKGMLKANNMDYSYL